MKREFYNKHVDTKFSEIVETSGQDEMAEF